MVLFGGRAGLLRRSGIRVVRIQRMRSIGFLGGLMRLVLMACIFFTGVYLGLHADPEGGLVQVMDQIESLIQRIPFQKR